MTTKINLLPWRAESQLKRIYCFKIQMVIFLVVAGLILLSWHIFLQQKINLATKQANLLQKQLNLVSQQIQDNSKLKQQQELQQQAINQAVKLEQQQAKFIQIFEAVHQGVSANLHLTQLLVNDHEVKIIGQAKLLSDLKQLITKLSQIKGGAIPSIQKVSRQNNGYEFVLLWLYRGIPCVK